MKLEFQLSLQQLSLIAVAENAWNQDDIVKKTNIYFCSPNQPGKYEIWELITKEAIKQVDSSLPEHLYNEVVLVVDAMGKKKCDWFIYLKRCSVFRRMPRHEFYENYLKDIHWTYYGTISEEKIIMSWFHKPNCDLWTVYIMASCFCSEEVIREIWYVVSKKYKPDDFKKLYKRCGWHLAAYWDRRFNNDLENFIADIKMNLEDDSNIYEEENSVEVNLFHLAVKKGYKIAAKKFWLELNKEEQANNIQENSNVIIDFFENSNDVGNCYRQDQYLEIFYFLLSNLNASTLKQLCQSEDDLYEIIQNLFDWPWIKLIVPFVCYTEHFLEEEQYEEILLNLAFQMTDDDVDKRDTLNKRKFYQLWRIVPHDYKKIVSKRIIHDLFTAWDLKIITLIITDKALTEIRQDLIEEGYFMFEKFLEENNGEEMKIFVKEVLVLKAEKKETQLKLNKVYEYLLNDEFHSADKYLKSFQNPEEDMKIKSLVDDHFLCTFYLKKNQYDLADKYLDWKGFHGADFKFDLSLSNFFVNQVFSFWNISKSRDNVKNAEVQSANFLKWFSDTDSGRQKMYLMKLMLAKKISNRYNIFIEKFIGENNFEIIDDLLKWLLFQKEDIYYWKKKHFPDKKIFEFLQGYMERNENDLAKRFLDWAVDGGNRRAKVISKFFKSSFCIFGCKSFIAEHCGSSMFKPKLSDEEITGEMKNFIGFWMKLSTDWDDLKSSLEKWPETSWEKFEREITAENETDDDDLESDHTEVFCEKENLNTFKYLLKSFEKNNYEFFD